jgi:hypothetical protein
LATSSLASSAAGGDAGLFYDPTEPYRNNYISVELALLNQEEKPRTIETDELRLQTLAPNSRFQGDRLRSCVQTYYTNPNCNGRHETATPNRFDDVPRWPPFPRGPPFFSE